VELIHGSGAHALIYEFGAHVASWGRSPPEELIFMSDKCVYDGKKALRGGIPVCFPQFANQGPLVNHGFARTTVWDVEDSGAQEDGSLFVVLVLPTNTGATVWPFPHKLSLVVVLTSTDLRVEIIVKNEGSTPLEFTAALHTYFRVPDITTARVRGLKGLTYEDKVSGRTLVEERDEISFSSEVDSKYFRAPDSNIGVINVSATGPNKTLGVTKSGFPDAVVWNPSVEKATAMADLGAEGFKNFVCMEAAIVERPQQLEPGAEWNGWIQLGF